jgi:phytoene dehydrogenase-like protein
LKKLNKRDYDAIVVGSGPNGLAAAITIQQAGLSVLLLEAKEGIGGGLRTAELTLPGYFHDVCSAIHPMAAGSPFFKTLPLEKYGLEFIYPAIEASHPFDDGTSVELHRSVDQTAESFEQDRQAYLSLMKPLLANWSDIESDVLAPLRFPQHPLKMMQFGYSGLSSSLRMAKRFHGRKARGLWAGMAAHSILPLSAVSTSAVAMVLMLTGHLYGWPIAKGGSIQIANALAAYFISLGGEIKTNFYVHSLNQLPSSHAVLFDITPKQLLKIAGHKFSSLYRWQLERYRYGPGVFKIDWALDGQIPFTSPQCRKAGTVHLGNTLEEIADAEKLVSKGKHPERPFILLAQQSLFDTTRAPEGKHTGWAYCHVPNGSEVDMTNAIEQQVERFAPGFKDLILARHTMNTAEMEDYDANYVGGDINGGKMDIQQLFTRPALRYSPYRTSAKGLYICSSSTPPGGGVHGMCGFHAAKKALKDIFNSR